MVGQNLTFEETVQLLHRDGLVELPGLFNVEPFVEHLKACPIYQNHVRQRKMETVELGSHPWTCHDMGDVTRAPELLETALSVRPIVRMYLGTDQPYLYSLNAFYCEPNALPKPDIQDWHRDADDTKFLALFVYCTDVQSADGGPHQFMRGSHPEGHGRLSDPLTVLGPAGTMFLADTRGLHRGVVPRHKRRMIAWARWGVSCPPASYVWDGLEPLPKGQLGARYPSDPKLQEAIRLIAA